MQAKKSFAEGRKEAVLKAAPGTVQPPCQYHSACGGCTLQELPYDAQLAAKQARFVFELGRQGGLGEARAAAVVEGVTPCAQELRWALRCTPQTRLANSFRVITPMTVWRDRATIASARSGAFLYNKGIDTKIAHGAGTATRARSPWPPPQPHRRCN